MLFAAILPGLMLVLFGASVFAAALLLTRANAKRSTAAPSTEQTASKRICVIEGRLKDYDSEIEGRMKSTLALLDGLIAEADSEIEHLRGLVQQQRAESGKGTPAEILNLAEAAPKNRIAQHLPPGSGAVCFSNKQKQMIRDLQTRGYSTREIAALVDATEDDIRAILEDDERSQAA